MKKKLFIMIPLILLLSACGKQEVKINNTSTEKQAVSQEDKESFDNVFDMFTSQVGDIREEYNDKEVVSEEEIIDKSISDIDVRSYTNEDLGVVVNYLDVENGEAILVESSGEFLLIDTGNVQTSQELLDYVKGKTSTLKYLVITHPQTDRLGGVIDILDNLEVSEVILPNIKVNSDSIFMNMIDKLNEKEIKVTEAKAGDNYLLGTSDFDIIAPNGSDYNDLDNYSVCIKLNYGDNSFLFMGDAKSISETEILDNKIDVNADVLKVAHYGSRYSTSAAFLDKVSPQIAVINPANNPKNYPDKDTLSKLDKRGIMTYRTDTNGVISIGSDGTNLYAITEIAYAAAPVVNETETEKPKVQTNITVYPEDADTFIVYAGRDKIYHLEDCDYRTNISNEMTLSVAHNMGYKPCDKCHPPEIKENTEE